MKMRKMTFVLAVVILAKPAWADIAIILTDLGGGKFAIDYSGTELARSFALDITVDTGTIDTISDFAVGDDNQGYGIFPANFRRHITVDPTTGEVSDWADPNYTPVAEAPDPGALGGLGTNGITIEMGSLYDTKAPPLRGRLCAFTCSKPCHISVVMNATRGNVVLKDGSQATVDLSAATDVPLSWLDYGIPRTEWEAVGEPDCWLAAINPRQCHGDADGKSEGKAKYWVSTGDLDVLIAAWNKPFAWIDGETVNGVLLICADFDHLPEGKKRYRVSVNDLDILVANWQIADGPSPDCP
jgi:hypothetical protein